RRARPQRHLRLRSLGPPRETLVGPAAATPRAPRLDQRPRVLDVRARDVAVDLLRRPVRLEGLVVLLEAAVGVAELGVGLGGVPVELNRLLELADRRRVLSLAEQRGALPAMLLGALARA